MPLASQELKAKGPSLLSCVLMAPIRHRWGQHGFHFPTFLFITECLLDTTSSGQGFYH